VNATLGSEIHHLLKLRSCQIFSEYQRVCALQLLFIELPNKTDDSSHPHIYITRCTKTQLTNNGIGRRKSSSSSSTAAAPQPPPPQAAPPDPTLILFARGVIARLELWPALRVAVEQGWGGPSSREKRRWLASEIVDAFDSASSTSMLPDAEYVAAMLAQALEDEFDALFEDGSVEGVAADVVALWGAGEDVVREWERKVEGARGKKVDVQEVVDDEDEWEDEESEEGEDEDADEAPQLMPTAAEVRRREKPTPVTDEDGFTLVQKGRR
jgi:pre-rRNA-processing protein TSR2